MGLSLWMLMFALSITQAHMKRKFHQPISREKEMPLFSPTLARKGMQFVVSFVLATPIASWIQTCCFVRQSTTQFGLLAYNMLRFIGQESLRQADARVCRKRNCRGIRTAIQNLITPCRSDGILCSPLEAGFWDTLTIASHVLADLHSLALLNPAVLYCQ